MDINGIRLRNYKALLVQFKNRPDQASLPEHGLLTRFTDYCGVNVRYLSHINNGRKNIGDRLARQLERGFGLAHGWLDQNHGTGSSANKSEDEFVEMALTLYRENPTEVQTLLMRYMMGKIGK